MTRPRADDGVTNGTSVLRMNTLTESAALNNITLRNAIAKLCVTPNVIVNTPKRATAMNIIGPVRR
jgi:hypothetical protein